ncbi:MAG: ATP-binding protein [Acidimicrobiales bacterium]
MAREASEPALALRGRDSPVVAQPDTQDVMDHLRGAREPDEGEPAAGGRDVAGRRDERAAEAEDVSSKLDKLLQRDLGRHRVLIALCMVVAWAVVSVVVYVELTGSPHQPTVASRTLAWLFPLVTGVMVGVILVLGHLAGVRIREGLRDADEALRSIERVTDPSLSFLVLDDLLDRLLTRVTRAVHGDVAVIDLVSEDDTQLTLRAWYGIEGLARPNKSVPMGVGVAGVVAQRAEAVIVNDVGVARTEAPCLGGRVASLLGAPLLVGGKVVGVVLVGARGQDQFSDRDLRLLQLVADRSAASIERARLDEAARRGRLGAEHSRRHVALLANTGFVLAKALEGYDEAMVQLADLVVPAFADWFAIDLVGEDGRLRRVVDRDHSHLEVPTDGAEGHSEEGTEEAASSMPGVLRDGLRGRDSRLEIDVLVQRVVSSGHPEVFMRTKRSGAPHDGEPAPLGDYFEALPASGIESMFVVPVQVRGVSFGALTFATGSGRRGYRRSDLETGKGVAERVAITVERVLLWHESREAEKAASRRAAENTRLYQAVRSNEQRLRAVLDSSPLAIAELDLDGCARWWNRAAGVLFEWEVSGGGPCRIIARDEVSEAVLAQLWERTKQGESTLGADVAACLSDGELLDLSVSTAPLREHEAEVTGILVVVEDVTERRQMLEQAQQAERLAAMARLAGVVAHDFNNLLTVILGCSEVLLRRMRADALPSGHEAQLEQLEEQTGQRAQNARRRQGAGMVTERYAEICAQIEEVEAIERAGRRAAALTSQLLAIGPRQVVTPVVVDPDTLVAEMRPMLLRVLGASVELEHVPASSPVRIVVDPAELERAVLNLAINACDAMSAGGRLVVQSQLVAGRHPTHPRWAALVVSDTGTGMDSQTAEHCFEPFFTTKDVSSGTGLGLAAVHAMVTQAGGNVTLDTSPGQGTTFTLWFPAVDAETTREGEEELAEHFGHELVLLVEDDDELRRLVARELTWRGYRVMEASGGAEALEVAGSLDEQVDLLVTDVVMPEMSGVELSRRLSERWPSVPVLFVSGHLQGGRAVREDLAEDAELLAKPFTPDQLARRVRHVLDRSVAPSPEPSPI